MGQQQSKDEQLYQQVNYGNVEAIKALHRDGARLEWIDEEKKTPLIAACMNPELYKVAKTLIELGADVNAYRPGRHAGTPLHHAARRDLEQTVKLLLSHGANALVMNDDRQTPLDVARTKGYSNVVRTIESRICLFSGWLRELSGPGFLELPAPQLLSRKVWVAVLPCDSSNLGNFKLELAIYTSVQDAQPCTIIALWNANMDEPNFNQPDPAVIILVTSTIPGHWWRRRGIVSSQVASRVLHFIFWPELSYSIEGAMTQKHVSNLQQLVRATSNSYSGFAMHAKESSVCSSLCMTDLVQEELTSAVADYQIEAQRRSSVVQTTIENLVPAPIPSAPVADAVIDNDGPIHYPQIDTTPLDPSQSPLETSDARAEGKKDTGASSSCVICLDAPAEGVCVPCGHWAGCMSCLNGIKAKKGGCPICRAKIDQVIQVYAV